MAAKPVLAELLRFIAANEQLPRTLARYPGYDRDTLGKLIAAAADRVEELEGAREPGAGGAKGVKVRRQSEVEKLAARTAEELDEGMTLALATDLCPACWCESMWVGSRPTSLRNSASCRATSSATAFASSGGTTA